MLFFFFVVSFDISHPCVSFCDSIDFRRFRFLPTIEDNGNAIPFERRVTNQVSNLGKKVFLLLVCRTPTTVQCIDRDTSRNECEHKPVATLVALRCHGKSSRGHTRTLSIAIRRAIDMFTNIVVSFFPLYDYVCEGMTSLENCYKTDHDNRSMWLQKILAVFVIQGLSRKD